MVIIFIYYLPKLSNSWSLGLVQAQGHGHYGQIVKMYLNLENIFYTSKVVGINWLHVYDIPEAL